MNDKEIEELLSELKLEKSISLEEIPNLDLYMDQVIQLFENKFGGTLRNDKEKVLTKTMINNYSKDKLLMQTKNKKYSKSHMILLSLIYQFKGSLSINDIKTTLSPIVKSFDTEDNFPIEEFYSTYLKLFEQNVEAFEKALVERINDATNLVVDNKALSGDYEQKLMTLISLVNMSNLYRKVAEKILDEYMTTPKK